MRVVSEIVCSWKLIERWAFEMKTKYTRPAVPAQILSGNRLLEPSERFVDGDWYGAGWGFRFVVGTAQTGVKAGDLVDGPCFSYNPCRPIK